MTAYRHAMRNIDRRNRIVGHDLEQFGGPQAGERGLGFEDRQGAFQAEHVELRRGSVGRAADRTVRR